MSAVKNEIKRKLHVAAAMLKEAIKMVEDIPEADPGQMMDIVGQNAELINIILKGVVNGKIEKDDVLDNKFLHILERMKEEKKSKIEVEMDALETELEMEAAKRFRNK